MWDEIVVSMVKREDDPPESQLPWVHLHRPYKLDGRAAAVSAWPWRRLHTASECTRSECCSRAPEIQNSSPRFWPTASPTRSQWAERWGYRAQESGRAATQDNEVELKTNGRW